ncbi:hypothetical protein [Magnetospira sp. QH-2]|uniref:hypothetical protein n=1 Tax=Magnetospira sp. (strain QH-2) TaxID=1288970 RepID=UPI0003E80FBB|nr:hypothetical protein [Magnetospira sp. QH-2]CCQ73104.1 protein of unknown function [Magnetospira sp. QH-2]
MPYSSADQRVPLFNQLHRGIAIAACFAWIGASTAIADPATSVGLGSKGGLQIKDLGVDTFGDGGFGNGGLNNGNSFLIPGGTSRTRDPMVPGASPTLPMVTPDSAFQDVGTMGADQPMNPYQQPRQGNNVNLGKVLDMYGATPEPMAGSGSGQPGNTAAGGQVNSMQSPPTAQDPATAAATEALKAVKSALSAQGGSSGGQRSSGGQDGSIAASPLIKETIKDIATNILDPTESGDGSVSISILGLGRVTIDKSNDTSNVGAVAEPGTAANEDLFPNKQVDPFDALNQDAIRSVSGNARNGRVQGPGMTGMIKSLFTNWMFYAGLFVFVGFLFTIQRVAFRSQ